MSIPQGSLLVIDRIYIRGNTAKFREFDSVSFRLLEWGDQEKTIKKIRFWAKLEDVNQIEWDQEDAPPKKSRRCP